MDLTLYGYDASLEKGKPDVVVLPDSAEQVSRVVALAYEVRNPDYRPGIRHQSERWDHSGKGGHCHPFLPHEPGA
jgi:FAD/FMN-containing dehydrogenase